MLDDFSTPFPFLPTRESLLPGAFSISRSRFIKPGRMGAFENLGDIRKLLASCSPSVCGVERDLPQDPCTGAAHECKYSTSVKAKADCLE